MKHLHSLQSGDTAPLPVLPLTTEEICQIGRERLRHELQELAILVAMIVIAVIVIWATLEITEVLLRRTGA